MTFNAMTEHYEEITVCGKPALFTSIRIRRDTIPDGLYAYDVRHDDEWPGHPLRNRTLCDGQPLGHHYPCGTAGSAGRWAAIY